MPGLVRPAQPRKWSAQPHFIAIGSSEAAGYLENEEASNQREVGFIGVIGFSQGVVRRGLKCIFYAVRIACAYGGAMKRGYRGKARKRAVKLTLNEDLLHQAKSMTDNLSGIVESLLWEFVALETTVAVWNDFDARIGSFADEYSSL
jgi:antitoxin CcdA